MNFVLFVQDPTNVWNPTLPPDEITDLVRKEIANLVSDWTMSRVTVGLQSESGRIEELEGIISGNIDQWSEAKEIVAQLIRNVNSETAHIHNEVNALRVAFGLDIFGDDE